ncbi:MAG: helix-turn-helix domain-containing protein [Candidatus Portnoybacteria bacterium]|nr:helix-turn-helix domain-containing protein [Candidatus Portnoybacteria bacterium]
MTLAERLKKAREEAGLSLEKAAELSKIQVKYLDRLEKSEYEKLPAPVYMQAFLKKYIKILNLPTEETLAQYKEELNGNKILRQRKLKELPILKSPKLVITPRTISFGIIAILIVLIIGYLVYQIDYIVAPPKINLDYPSEDLTTSRSSIEISGQTDSSAKLTVNGEQVYIDKDGKFRQEINLSLGMNTLKFEAENRFGKKSEILRQIMVK